MGGLKWPLGASVLTEIGHPLNEGAMREYHECYLCGFAESI